MLGMVPGVGVTFSTNAALAEADDPSTVPTTEIGTFWRIGAFVAALSVTVTVSPATTPAGAKLAVTPCGSPVALSVILKLPEFEDEERVALVLPPIGTARVFVQGVAK